ncbi:EamA family transporter [Bordetella petrii]|nr:EamA family transporter [Bordetella petrii]
MASPRMHPVTRAAAWMGGALVALAAMAVASRELAAHLSVFQILFFRSACGLLVVCLILWRSGWSQVRTTQLGGHIIRNASHFCAQYGWVYGMFFMPMAAVIAIEFTAPVWTILLAAIIVKERITSPRMVSVALGLAGVWLIVRPGSSAMHPAALAVLGSAVAFALTYVMTKKLMPTETPLCILFYMSAVQLALAIVPSTLDWKPIPQQALHWIAVVGLASLVTHYCLARAMKLADATIVVPLDFLRLPFIAMIGAWLYGETVQATLFMGAGLILSGNLYSVISEKNRSR